MMGSMQDQGLAAGGSASTELLERINVAPHPAWFACPVTHSHLVNKPCVDNANRIPIAGGTATSALFSCLFDGIAVDRQVGKYV